MTTFNMLLGEFGNTYDDIFSDLIYYGVLMIPAVIFFYTFMFIVFLVILNFLLAIVVDAFTDVKSENQDGSRCVVSRNPCSFSSHMRWLPSCKHIVYCFKVSDEKLWVCEFFLA